VEVAQDRWAFFGNVEIYGYTATEVVN
jgi:hypothetical protein